jgi:hypothetical protein
LVLSKTIHHHFQESLFEEKFTPYSWNHEMTRVISWLELTQSMISLEWRFLGYYVTGRIDVNHELPNNVFFIVFYVAFQIIELVSHYV